MSKYVSYKKLHLKNDKGDTVIIHEQNHYNEWAYTVMSVNGKEVKPKKLQSFAFVPDVNNVREEWKPYLIESGTYV